MFVVMSILQLNILVAFTALEHSFAHVFPIMVAFFFLV